MDADQRGFKHGDLTERIIGVFYDVYNELGHGYLEAIYREAMMIALTQVGFKVECEVPLKVWFRGQNIGNFKADLTVDGVVILELKAARMLDSVHEAQLLNYLRATEIEVGLLFNFGPKPSFKRVAFDNARKQISVYQR
ncbi:MAG: GxxExxY protein [Acidobacteria bacterium]|nr:GxxExxY protein [Acidobacteriota bacterium]